jgi:hypothetical protein
MTAAELFAALPILILLLSVTTCELLPACRNRWLSDRFGVVKVERAAGAHATVG